MPPRRRRAGSRPGTLGPELQEALRKEAVVLGSTVDPVERVRAVNDFYAQLDFELEQMAAVRLEAVRELRNQQMSYDRIAELTGLSKPRVAQLARAAEAGGRVRSRKP